MSSEEVRELRDKLRRQIEARQAIVDRRRQGCQDALSQTPKLRKNSKQYKLIMAQIQQLDSMQRDLDEAREVLRCYSVKRLREQCRYQAFSLLISQCIR